MNRPHGLTGIVMIASAFMAAPVLADGIRLEMDLTTDTSTLTLDSRNQNAGYSFGWGIIFTADEPITVNGAELWTKSSAGLNATFELWEIINTSGDSILEDARLVRSGSDLLIGDLGFHGVKFDEISLKSSQNYYIRALYEEAADENWFFDYDQRADPPIDFGPITVIDGAVGGSADTFGAPFMTLQIVPAPGTFALLVGAGFLARRRRRM